MSQYDINLAVRQYTTNVQLLSQQRGSRLRGACMSDSYTGQSAQVVDQFAAVESAPVTGRYQDLVPYDVLNDQRWVLPVDRHFTTYVDNFDKLRLAIDPMGSYVQSAVNSLGRYMDDVILGVSGSGGIFGTCKTGIDGGTNTAFSASNQLSVDLGGTASGLNTVKLEKARERLLEQNVDLDNDEMICLISPKQNTNLMQEVQLVNNDFRANNTMQTGEVGTALGMRFIVTNRLPTNGSGYRRCVVFMKSGLHLGIWGDIMTSIDKVVTKSSQPYQLYARMTIGATRTEEALFIELPCAES